MDNLLVFICTSQEDVLRISKKSSDYSFHRYYITTGFEINKQSDIFSDSDSFLSVHELDSKNYSAMSRIALLYSMPSYENIIILKSNEMFDLAEIKFIFGKLEKGDQISRDYLVILQRQNVALNGFPDVQDELPVIDYGLIMNRAMNEEMLKDQELKIALSELMPPCNYTFEDEIDKNIKNIFIQTSSPSSKQSYGVFLNRQPEGKGIVIDYKNTQIKKYTAKLVCENFAVYLIL
jgi:hypothetical protein